MSIQKQLFVDAMYSKKIPVELVTLIKEFTFPTVRELQEKRKQDMIHEIKCAFSSKGATHMGYYSMFEFVGENEETEIRCTICNTCGNYWGAYYNEIAECVICMCGI